MLVAAAVLLDRGIAWALVGPHVIDTIRANPDWLTWQFLPRSSYLQAFRSSIYYLQQTPPLPHLVLGVAIRLLSWPVNVALALFAMQACISTVTAAVLYVLLLRMRCHWLVAAAVTLWFGLSTDLYLMELNSFGQLFYESSAMMLLTTAAVCLCNRDDVEGSQGRSRFRALAAGVLTGLGILTRASFAYLALPIAIAVAIKRGLKGLIPFLVPVILLQGGWCMKNALVYGNVSVAPSSWSGMNAANGLNVANGYATPDQYDALPFVDFILSEPDRYPDWFIAILRKNGYVDWDSKTVGAEMPQAVQDRQAAIQRATNDTDPFTNSITIRMLSDQYARAVTAYTLAHPGVILSKIWLGYTLFWQPIANYSGMFMGPVFTEKRERQLSGPYLDLYEDGMLRVNGSGEQKPATVTLPTVPLSSFDTLTILILHILVPVLILGDAVARWRGRQGWISGDLWVLLVIAGYGVFVSSAVDIGENMRFRLAYEPILIAVTVGAIVAGLAVVRRAGSRRRRPEAPA